MTQRHLTGDEGFSLSEMLVVLALMGLVLAGAWALFHLASMGASQSTQQAWISREIGQPLTNAERAFSQQAPPLLDVGPYTCTFRTDQDRDNLYEVHRFEATTDGKLLEVYYEETGSLTATPTIDTRHWSDHNSNRAAGVPLIRYLDRDGNEISSASVSIIKQYTASVIVTIVTNWEGKQYSDSRQIYFRNR